MFVKKITLKAKQQSHSKQMKQQIQSYRKTGPLFDDNLTIDDPPEKELRRIVPLDFDVSELYKQIGAPNPIINNNLELTSASKNANVNGKLASPISGPKYASLSKPLSVLNSLQAVNINKQEPQSSAREHIINNHNDPLPTLFNLYPETDIRLVYRKYPNDEKKQAEFNSFASHFVDIGSLSKLLNVVDKKNKETRSTIHQNIEDQQTLIFDSKFESGNLYSAYKVADNEYDLILQNDINTHGYTQWFFFSVQNTRKDMTIKFNIVNLLKPDSLFNEGMQPVIYSTSTYHSEKKAWFRGGFNVSYSKNNIIREGLRASKTYYTLTFEYTFSHSNDTVYFAHCFPYTYTRLTEYLDTLSKDSLIKRYIKRKPLCETLAGNSCEYLTITEGNLEKNTTKDERPIVFLTARQHPGESLSSFIMEGILQFLTSEEYEAHLLRRLCIFKVIPMLNPDGVVFGNYRASLCGKDLNRKWKAPKKILQPTIYYTKQLIRHYSKTHAIKFFCDFHGHSRKKDAFFYGNATESEPLMARVFPLLISKISKYVSFDNSRFTVHRSKESTARVALWKELNIDDVFTLEASFHGYSSGTETCSFTEDDYRNLGRDFCKALAIYLSQTLTESASLSKSALPKNDTVSSIDHKAKGGLKKQDLSASALFSNPQCSSPVRQVNGQAISTLNLINELKDNKSLINIGFQSDDSGSDSDPSGDDLPEQDLNKLFRPKSKQMSFKRHNKKLKTGREKPMQLFDTSKKIIRQTSEAQIQPHLSSTNVANVRLNKEEERRASSTRSTPFRIKYFKKATQQIHNRDTTDLRSITSLINNPKVDISCQTEETGLMAIEEAKQQQTREAQNHDNPSIPPFQFMVNFKGFKKVSPRNFRNNIIAVKHITSSTNLGSLTLLNQNAFLLQPSKFKTSENGVCLRGSKIETDCKSKIAQLLIGKHYSSRGTTTDINMQTDKDLNLYNIFHPWPLNVAGTINKVESIRDTSPLHSNFLVNLEKKALETRSQEDGSKLEQKVARISSKESPQAQIIETNDTLLTEMQESQDFTLNTVGARGTQFFRKYIKIKIPINVSESQTLINPTSEMLENKTCLKRESSCQGLHETGHKSSERRSSSNTRLFRKSSISGREERNIRNLHLGYNPPLQKETIDLTYVGKGQNILQRVLKISNQKGLVSSSRPESLLNEDSIVNKSVKLVREMKESLKKCGDINDEIKYIALKKAQNKIASNSLTPKRGPSNLARNFSKKG